VTALPREPIGATGLAVTRLMLGTAPLGGLFEPVSDADAQATLEAAWAAGIRGFDTAPHYGVGLSEQRLGAFLAGLPRDQYVLSTKVGRLLVPAGGKVEGVESFYGTPRLTRVRDYSRDGVRASLEASLERLGADRIDVALVHDAEDHMAEALDEAIPALAELRSAGVVSAIGVGMNFPDLAERFVTEADVDVVLIAGRYTLLNTSAAVSLLPACQRRGVAVWLGGVFNSGILAGAGTYDYAAAPAEVAGRARQIAAACARHGVPLAAAALQFALHHPAVTAALVGARAPGEVREDVSYLAAEVPAALFGELAAAGLIPAAEPPEA
jgi:D-threo-aldose 1-dehydrogenase